MKEKNKYWLKLVMQITALALVILAIIFMWQLNQLEDVSTPIGRQLWFKPSLIVTLIILYQIGRTMTWLIIYYHFNPDRVKAIIPEGFKGFHHKTDHEIIKILNEAYDDYYVDKQIYSVKKVALWRSRGRKRFGLEMITGDRGWKRVFARHFLLAVEIKYRQRKRADAEKDYYYFSNGNLITSPASSSLELPYGWSIKEDILGQTK